MKTASPPLPSPRTQGCRIVLADGRELIDGVASWWTACHGYNHPHIRAAVERQLARMPHVMFGGLVHEPALTLARRLADAAAPADLDRVFFSDSGSVAVEVALKMAVQYWRNRGVAERTRFVAFTRRLSWRHRRRDGGLRSRRTACTRLFAGLLPQQITVDLPVDEASAQRVRSAACRARAKRSPRSLSSRWCRARAACAFTSRRCCGRLRAAADRYDVLLIFDEIFTGFGRTGSLFAFQAAGVAARYHHLSQGADRRHAAACGDDGEPKSVRGLLVGRSGQALMHGPTFMANRARLRRRQCLARPVRARTAARSGRQNLAALTPGS